MAYVFRYNPAFPRAHLGVLDLEPNAGTSNENVRASRGGVSASCATATGVNPAANDGTAHESADRP